MERVREVEQRTWTERRGHGNPSLLLYLQLWGLQLHATLPVQGSRCARSKGHTWRGINVPLPSDLVPVLCLTQKHGAVDELNSGLLVAQRDTGVV